MANFEESYCSATSSSAVTIRVAPVTTTAAASCQNPNSSITFHGIICVIILFSINLLNYMDRYTVAGVLPGVQEFYHIDDAMAGFLQTVFIIFYMIFAPLFGYLGDRYNRKWIMVVGLTIWVTAVLASSFVPSDIFWLFLLLRGIVGLGECSYSIIAPSIIADLFTKNTRSRVLMVFYFAIPAGSGAGYMVGSGVAGLFGGDWQWGIRVTPVFGLLCILALIFFIQEPARGEAEKLAGASHATEEKKSSYWADLKYLLSVKTYLWSTLGNTAVVFVTGTLAWWAPTCIQHSYAAEQGLADIAKLSGSDRTQISLIFGAVTCVGGILGVTLGVVFAQMWKEGKYCFSKNERADALICAIGSTAAIPFFYGGMHLIASNRAISWILIFITITFLCLNWAITVDMLLYIILPRKRNVANSWLTTISHLFGDASGPYIIGLVSDWIRGSDTKDPKSHYNALLQSFYIPNALLVISAVALFASAVTVLKDKRNFEQNMGYRNKSGEVEDIAMLESFNNTDLETTQKTDA